MEENILMNVGLSKNEAKVYLALFELGSTTAGKISEISKIHRTNCHDVLKKLIGRGLVSYITRNKIKYYKATNPKNLIDILKDKEEKLKSIIPKLELQKNLTELKSETNIYDDLRVLKHILNKLLEKNEPIMSFGKVDKLLNGLLFKEFNNERVKRKILMKHIYHNSDEIYIRKLKSLEYTKLKKKFRFLLKIMY